MVTATKQEIYSERYHLGNSRHELKVGCLEFSEMVFFGVGFLLCLFKLFAEVGAMQSAVRFIDDEISFNLSRRDKTSNFILAN